MNIYNVIVFHSQSSLSHFLIICLPCSNPFFDFLFLILSLQTIAAYARFHLGRLDKLQGKVMTQKLEWWIG